MKKFSKIIALLLIAIMACSLTACGGDDEKAKQPSSTPIELPPLINSSDDEIEELPQGKPDWVDAGKNTKQQETTEQTETTDEK
jgi:hypothetical protein